MNKTNFLNLPNIITLSRIAVLPFIIYLILTDLYGNMKMLFLLLLYQGLSDMADGYIARKTGQVTRWGMMLDPVADKLTFDAIMLSLIKYGFPVSIAALLLIRDITIVVVSVFIIKKYKDIPKPNLLGKLTTFLIVVFILTFILSPDQTRLVLSTPVIIVLILSGVSYIIKTIKYLKEIK